MVPFFPVCLLKLFKFLKASEQHWFSSQQRWKRKFSELKISAEQRWFSVERRWFLTDSELQFLVTFSSFLNFFIYLNFKAHNCHFKPNLRKEIVNKNLDVQFFYRLKLLQQLKIFQKNIFAFSGKLVSKTLSFCCHFVEYFGENSYFL